MALDSDSQRTFVSRSTQAHNNLTSQVLLRGTSVWKTRGGTLMIVTGGFILILNELCFVKD